MTTENPIAEVGTIAFTPGAGLVPQNFEGAWRLAACAERSGLAPRGMNREALVIAMGFGAELGLSPMASIQSVAVISGRPTLFGDALLALCQSSGLLEHHAIAYTGTGDDRAAEFTVKRKGYPEASTSRFSVRDAKGAGLWGKPGPWTQYPDRMLLARARAFGLRDTFPDVLKGMGVAEEQQDIERVRGVEAIVRLEPRHDPDPVMPDEVRAPDEVAAEPPRRVRLGAR